MNFINKNNKNNENDEKKENSDLLNFLKYILGCTYVSDLRFEPYNTKAKSILNQLDLKKYTLKQIKDSFEYVYRKK